jgi:uncharacterized protein (TIGR02246 family)
MKPYPQTLAVLVLVLSSVACSTDAPPADSADDAQLTDVEARAIVERMNQEWDAAIIAGDFEAAVAMYAQDAIRMQPDLPALEGRDAIRAWMLSESDTYTFEGSNEILEVRALSPDWIMMRGVGTFTATPKVGGEPRYQEEKWLTLVQRQADGSWKWYRDSGSSDLPR